MKKFLLFLSLLFGIIATMEKKAYSQTFEPLNTGLAVGEIPMSSSVTQTGAVTYTVPIEVYPGINGMQPNLALVYNSHAGNGYMGMGWNVGGLSSITRGNKNMYYDGNASGIKMETTDAFYLDGMRLIRTNGTQTPPKYESEHGNITATATLTTGNLPAIRFFDVVFPDGTTGRYGSSTNTVNRLEYPLTELTDLYNNKITYTYTYVTGKEHYRLTQISYANSSVEFEYKATRHDSFFYYSGGVKVTIDALLEKITCKFGTQELWKYEFEYYEFNNFLPNIEDGYKNASVLKKIDYKSSGGQAFNPLQFRYGENNNSTGFQRFETTLTKYIYTYAPQFVNIKTGKFDYGTVNDGLIVFEKNHPYSPMGCGFMNTYLSTQDIYLNTGLNKLATTSTTLKTEAGFIDIFTANIDGKGNDEIIKVNNVVHYDYEGNKYYDRVIFKVYSAVSGNSIISNPTTHIFDFETVIPSYDHLCVHPKFYYVGDFMGNGKQQILVVSMDRPNNNTSRPTKCYLFDLQQDILVYAGEPFRYDVTIGDLPVYNPIDERYSDRIYIVDYDGNGKMDICLIKDNGTYMFSFDESYNLINIFEDGSGLEIPCYNLQRRHLMNKILLVGDINGDGKTDFLLSPEDNYTGWETYYSTGDGQFDTSFATGFTRLKEHRYFLQDVNSDGQSDLIVAHQSSFTTHYAKNGKLFQSSINNSYHSTQMQYEPHIVIPVDNTSGNNSGQFITLIDNELFRFSFLCNTNKEKLLTGAVSSFGVADKNFYRMAYNATDFYTVGTSATYPHADFQGPLFIAEKREQYNGNKTEELKYKYENGIINLQGFGFQGFKKIITTDVIRSNRTFTQEFAPNQFSLLKEIDSHTKKVNYNHDVTIDAQTKIAKINLTSQITHDKLTGTKDTITYSNFDTYGFPKLINISYGGEIKEKITNSYAHNTAGYSYPLGFVTGRTSAVTRNGQTWTTRDTITVHEKGRPKTLKRYVNGNSNIVSEETFGYNTKGNMTSHKTEYFGSGRAFTTHYGYDNWGRLTSERDTMKIITAYNYNSTNGSLSSIENYKDQKPETKITATYSYDAFYRPYTITYTAAGTTETLKDTIKYSWNALGTNSLFCIQQISTGKPWSKTYFDAYGRETAASVQGFANNTSTTVEKEYDTFGRLKQVSLPYIVSSNPVWNIYSYTADDRLSSFTEASGRITSYTYSGRSVTVTKEGIASKYEYDTQGNLVKVTDPAGDIEYSLRPDGQPNSIKAPGNVTTSFTYDNFGRKLTSYDPSIGTQIWTYDTHGNIKTEKDAKNITITYNYDGFNRLESVVRPEFTTTYGYHPDLGMLTSVSTPGNGSTVYTYDKFRRLETETETVPDGKSLKETYTYENGNVKSKKYTTQNGDIGTETYTYKTNGHLEEIKFKNAAGSSETSIWKLTAVNAFGQPTSVTSGASSNTITRTYSYTAFGYPEGLSAKLNNGTPFQNFSYTFNATTGNLSNRKDNTRTALAQENFTYDTMNRLTGYGANTVTYDNIKGNITGKSDASSLYQYSNLGQPYMILSMKNPTNAIPSNNQIITYNSFKRPATINEGIYAATFTNNGSGGRVKMEVKKSGQPELTRYYISDCYEIDVKPDNVVKEKLYLGGDFYSAPAVYVKENGTWSLYHIFRDYLGSITHIRTATGAAKEENSYDPWGRRRDPATHTPYLPTNQPELFLGRGYTGHEHLPWFGLIHCNARLYDPVVGRFLAADPIIQDPTNTQNYNKYSYALNNPLKYTDPTGLFYHAGGYCASTYSTLLSLLIADMKTGGDFSNLVQEHSKYNSNNPFELEEVVVIAKRTYKFGIKEGSWEYMHMFGFPLNTPFLPTPDEAIPRMDPVQNISSNVKLENKSHAAAIPKTLKVVNGIQTGLDIAGLIPIYGEVADGINALIYLGRGQYGNAALSAGAMIPIAGWAATGTKLGVKGVKSVRNAKLATSFHPKTGVPFNKAGFPNFKNHLYKGGPNDVKIKPTGNMKSDIAAANNSAGYSSTPHGYTWHHHQKTGRMQLVESNIHMLTGHTGGFSLWK